MSDAGEEGVARSDLIARATFVVGLVIAVPVILVANRHQWFFADEWDFLSHRSLKDPSSLLQPHNDHWTSGPIVLYRVVFEAVGLHHYWPYQLLVIAAHLAAAALLWTVLRRTLRYEWVATAATLALVFLGAGRTDLAWAFQVTFTGALALGLGHLVLADHDPGPVRRRDLAGLACGAAALTFSSIGVAMAVVVGVAVLVRRGWRAAALHTLPLAALYLVWFAAYGHSGFNSDRPSGSQVVESVRWSFWDSLMGLGQSLVAALAVVALVVLGVVVIVSGILHPEGRSRYAAAFAMAVGAGTLTLMTGLGRSWFVPIGSGQTPSRYVHLVVVLGLPVVAVAADRLIEGWRWSAVPLALLLVASLVGNVRQIWPTGNEVFLLGSPQQIVEMAHQVREDPSVPDGYRPDDFWLPGLTAGWLRSMDRAGNVPDLRQVAPEVRDSVRLQLALEQVPTDRGSACRTAPITAPVALGSGDVLRVEGNRLALTQIRNGAMVGVGYWADLGEPVGPKGVRAVAVRARRPVVVLATPIPAGPTTVTICR